MAEKRLSMFTRVLLFITLLCLLPSPVKTAPINFTVWDFNAENTIPIIDVTGNAAAAFGSGLSSESFIEDTLGDFAWSFAGWPVDPGGTGTLDPSDYFEFMVDLTDYGHITLSFDELRTATGIRDFEVHYSIDGTNFTQIPDTVTNVPDDIVWRSHSFDLGSETAIDLAIRGQSTVYFRIYGYNAEGGIGGGRWRIDNVTFTATTNATAVTFSGLSATSPFAALAMALVATTGLVVLRKRK